MNICLVLSWQVQTTLECLYDQGFIQTPIALGAQHFVLFFVCFLFCFFLHFPTLKSGHSSSKQTKICPILFIPQACSAFFKYALSTLNPVSNLVDPDLGIDIFFKQEGATEKEGELIFQTRRGNRKRGRVDFERGD